MHPHHFHHIPQPSSAGIAPPAPGSAYQPHPGAYNSEEYNHNWNEEHLRALLHLANQLTGAGPSIAGTALTTNGHPCRWLVGDILCNETFAEFDDLIVHLRDHGVRGSAAQKLVCQWVTNRGPCNQEYRRDAFKRHIGIHAGLSFPCTECGQPFSREDSMRAHRERKHGNG